MNLRKCFFLSILQYCFFLRRWFLWRLSL
jgi:hypothetical protein